MRRFVRIAPAFLSVLMLAAGVYDRRPYKTRSAETCEVTFDAPGTLHVMVRGNAASSTFTVKGKRQ
jgi:hypothetical protein